MRKPRRRFRSQTIVIKKPVVMLLAGMFFAGVGLYALLGILSPFFAAMPASPVASMIYKLSIQATIPESQIAEPTLLRDFQKAVSLSALGFELSNPASIIAGQLPVVKASAAGLEPSGSPPAVRAGAATPPPAPTPPPADPDSPVHPIAEVSQVVGGVKYAPSDTATVYMDNHTSYSVDVEALLSEPLTIRPQAGQPFVLIVHTHTTESYTPAGQTTYHDGDSTRTQDKTQNVVRVGDEIAAQLEAAGISVIHDTTINDYPEYNGSYTRTLKIIESYLEKYPSIQVVLDVHRDGMTKADGTKLKVVADVDGQKTSQVMLYIGSDEGGLKHENWRENLKLGLRFQQSMSEQFPRLARPLNFVKERYNMHATPGSVILEVGSDGNTLEEACAAAKYAGKAIAGVLSKIK